MCDHHLRRLHFEWVWVAKNLVWTILVDLHELWTTPHADASAPPSVPPGILTRSKCRPESPPSFTRRATPKKKTQNKNILLIASRNAPLHLPPWYIGGAN